MRQEKRSCQRFMGPKGGSAKNDTSTTVPETVDCCLSNCWSECSFTLLQELELSWRDHNEARTCPHQVPGSLQEL